MPASAGEKFKRRYGCITGTLLYGTVAATLFMGGCNAITGTFKGDLDPQNGAHSDLWRSRPPIVRKAMLGLDDKIDGYANVIPYEGQERENRDDPWDAVGWVGIGAGILYVNEEQRRVRSERRGNSKWYYPSEFARYSLTGHTLRKIFGRK